MKYVILRDDDTNSFTPIEYLEILYRPFLDRGLPVNLATIPNVKSDVRWPHNQQLEGFLCARPANPPKSLPIAGNPPLAEYLKANPLFRIVQHGYHHEFVNGLPEFDYDDAADIARRLHLGTKEILEAGFPRPRVFVAPYDRIRENGYLELAQRFSLVSTGWFEAGRVPKKWWPALFLKKLRGAPHWQAGGMTFLSHPGCHLSYQRSYATMLSEIQQSINSRRLTVLVAHWWEFFRNNKPDQEFISVLHELADYLSKARDIEVISFDDVLDRQIPLN